EEKGKGHLIDLFLRYDVDRDPVEKRTYQDLADESGLTVHQVTVGLHWARQAFRDCFVAEVTDQVGSVDDLEDEMRILFGFSLR
ncbi:MAG: hypothetical protein QF752_12230, partial [Planctomycetota bacterium]|nr:hypothetical protein [Planctomycetota bacterium]